MGGMFGGSKPKAPKPPPIPKPEAPKPMADEGAIQEAQRKSRSALQQRAGRASTILSEGDRLGG